VSAPSHPPSADPDELVRQSLERWLSSRLPGDDLVAVTPFERAASGTSSGTQLFTLRHLVPPGADERMVLRTLPQGRGLFPDYDLGLQVGVMQALAGVGAPVPVVRWFEPDPAAIGAPFYIMECVSGDAPTDTPPGMHGHGLFFEASLDDRAAMWWRLIEAMVPLHALDWRALPLPQMTGMAGSATECMDQHIALLERWLAWSEVPRPAMLDAAFAALRTGMPPDARLGLVWGDARPGNALYRDNAVVALLDWEISSIGLPEWDPAYTIWSTEMLAEVNQMPRLSGLPSREETYARYEALAGRKIDWNYTELYVVARLTVMACIGGRNSAHDPYFERFLNQNVASRRLQEILAG
jgi:aminoglycoside phosphotransferase (APT) family kinase protein